MRFLFVFRVRPFYPLSGAAQAGARSIKVAGCNSIGRKAAQQQLAVHGE
ncbi:hypothetical protein [Albibacillus kandeliae]|jgi:hypothetical protein|nr:hypothetical protein [Albibacillus kandeliae]